MSGSAFSNSIVFIVVALTYTVTSKGYGHGRYTTGATVGGIGGRAPLGGMGNYAGGVGRSTYVGRTGGRGPLGGIGSFPGVTGRFAGRAGGITPFVGSYGGGVGPGTLRQRGYYGTSPQPYSINYEATDEQGGIQFKTESGDGSGNVQGNYGYFDSQGLYRQVEYTADQFGFRANIKTNEPGVGKESPADVNMIVEQTPAGIQEQYIPATAYQAGMPGQRGVEGIYGIGPVVRGFQGGISGGVPRSPTSAGYPAALVGGGPVSLGYQSCGMPGSSISACGTRAQSGSSGLFAGIKKSSSGKSIY